MTSPETVFRRASRRTAEILLWCGAALGTLGIVSAVAAVALGIVPLVFTSGSMSPQVPTGSLGLARTVAASELRIGDVVSVTAASGTRVTHRIVATEEQPDAVVLTLKGDTNPAPDQESYRVQEADRLFFSVPHVGRVIMFLTSPWGMFLGGLAAAALLFWAFRRQPSSAAGAGTDPEGHAQQPKVSPTESGRSSADHTRARTSMMLLAAGIPALLLVSANSGTTAFFTDTGTVTTTGFGTSRLLQPNAVTCTASSNTITVGTTPLADVRYTYWARAFNPAGVAVSGYKEMTGTPRKATYAAADFSPALSEATTYTFRIYSRIGAPGPTGWESDVFRRVLFSRVGTTLPCGEAVIPPDIVFVQPVNGFNGSEAQLRTLLARDCGGYGSTNPAVCGTAVDPNGSVVSVQYVIERSGFWGSYCWDGSGYPAFGSCAYRNAVRNVAENKWSIPGDVYQGIVAWNYTLTIKATDDLGGVTEKAIKFRVSP